MPRLFAALVAALALALTHSTAMAEPKGGPKGKAAAGPQVRYFDLSSSLFTELGAEAVLKETRQGTTLVSAELDVCHLVSPISNHLDRFVVPLKVDGNRLTGSAQSQERKQPVTVNLTRRVAGGHFSFEGTVTSGDHTNKIRSIENTEMSEDEIGDQFLAESYIEPSPASFSAAWPQSIFVRVSRSGLANLLDALRDQNVRLVFDGLQTSCQVLRSDRHTLQIDVEPERIAPVLAKLKSVAAVTEAGFSPNPPNMQRAVRFPSAGWRDGSGKLDREKFAAAVGKAAAGLMSATVGSTTWDPVLGELAIELKRPDTTVPGLKLTQVIAVTMVVAPESLASSQQSIVWVESIAARPVDERPAPRLTFAPAVSDEGGEGQEPEGSDGLVEAIAGALKGALWDSDKEQWRE
jgi:hypothetical protein